MSQETVVPPEVVVVTIPGSGRQALYVGGDLVYEALYISSSTMLDLLCLHGILRGYSKSIGSTVLTNRGQFPNKLADVHIAGGACCTKHLPEESANESNS